MIFIILVKFKKGLTREVIAENLKDFEIDKEQGVKQLCTYWTLGRYDTVAVIDAPNEKVAMNMVLRRMDRMDIEMLAALPASAKSPGGP